MKSLSRFGPKARTAFAAFLWVLAALAVCHLVVCSNTAVTVEYRMDADTKKMLKDLETVRRRELPLSSQLLLGVGWHHYRIVQYYQRRKNLTWLTVRETSRFSGYDFFYLPSSQVPRSIPSRLIVLKNYPFSGTTLAKLRPE
jgi:hypothetical protein